MWVVCTGLDIMKRIPEGGGGRVMPSGDAGRADAETDTELKRCT
jgi:hypothetical protein